GGKVRGINAAKAAEKYSRKNLDDLHATFASAGGKLLAWVKVEADKVSGSIARALTPDVQGELVRRLGGTPGDLLLVGAADTEDAACQAMGTVRQQAAAKLGLVAEAKERFKIAWVIDFPSFVWDADEKRWAANH